ncbi:MAG: GNAT family N-acetyltransferase [Nocardioidaceae bacterium]
MTRAHWPEVSRIYEAGIDTGHATFEISPPTWEHFDAVRREDPRLVALDGSGRVAGWVACSPVSVRPVYAGVVEHSIFVDPDTRGSGVGQTLLQAFIDTSESFGIWTVQSGIFRENTASLRLHEAAGFRVVGVRERVGRMLHGPLAGHWRDVVLVERRSATVGI